MEYVRRQTLTGQKNCPSFGIKVGLKDTHSSWEERVCLRVIREGIGGSKFRIYQGTFDEIKKKLLAFVDKLKKNHDEIIMTQKSHWHRVISFWGRILRPFCRRSFAPYRLAFCELCSESRCFRRLLQVMGPVIACLLTALVKISACTNIYTTKFKEKGNFYDYFERLGGFLCVVDGNCANFGHN